MTRPRCHPHAAPAPALFAAAVLGLLGAVAPPQDAAAQDAPGDADAVYAAAAAAADADLRAALEELAALREEIAAERPALAAASERTAAELREQRRRYEIARISRESAEAEFEKAERDISVWREERHYLDSLLLDFRRSYETQQSPARVETRREALNDPSLEGRLALVASALERLGRSGRVETFPGEALDSGGLLVPGTFAEAGPAAWFLSEDGRLSGLVADGPGLRPRVVPGTAAPEAVEPLLRGGPASPPLDPTLGTAAALEASGTGLLERIRQGGFWIYPILLLAAVALAAAAAKWIQLAGIRPLPPGRVQEVIDAVNRGETGEAARAAGELRHPAGALLARGASLGGKPRDEIEEALYEKFLEALPPLQRGLALIAIASATAPLLGLLGTVTGMIETFRLINIFGTGDAKSLSAGISEALVTTEFGLIVAIPALILHALLSRKVQGVRSAMEMSSLAFLNGIAPTRPAS